MGVWGVGPFDHDGAGDLFAAMMKPIDKLNAVWKEVPASEIAEHRRIRRENALRWAKAPKRIKHGRRPRRGKFKRWISSNAKAQDLYCEVRTNAALLLVSHGTDILGGPSLIPVLEALRKIRADKDWLDGWKTPRQIRAALDKEIRALAKKVKTCCEPNKRRMERRLVRTRRWLKAHPKIPNVNVMFSPVPRRKRRRRSKRRRRI